MIRASFACLLTLALCACGTTPTSYRKTVTVEKGPDGNVTRMVIVEEVSQSQRESEEIPAEEGMFQYLEE